MSSQKVASNWLVVTIVLALAVAVVMMVAIATSKVSYAEEPDMAPTSRPTESTGEVFYATLEYAQQILTEAEYARLMGPPTEAASSQAATGAEAASIAYGPSQAVAGDCVYTTNGDNPHISENTIDASAHGWWEDNSSPQICPAIARVRVQLQAMKCYNGLLGMYCWWNTEGDKTETHRAGGGSGHWTNARTFCFTKEPTGFRNVVDVDFLNMSDPPNKAYRAMLLPCRPRLK